MNMAVITYFYSEMSDTSAWKTDEKLENDLKGYVARNLKRSEILSFMRRDFKDYPWSLATLARRLKHFSIRYINYDLPLGVVQNAVANELDGPGKLLGYRAMNQKLRVEHGIQVPRHLVYNVMLDQDPDGLESRSLQKRNQKRKKPFICDGPLELVSLDGHDKLCGFQNWTFPLGVYGCIDTFSRKMLFLTVLYSNSKPEVIGKEYLDFLYNTLELPRRLRVDKGTETGKMATMHSYLTNLLQLPGNPVDAVKYGPSTTNKIERWWRDLHERLEMFFKVQLNALLVTGDYAPDVFLDRQICAFIFIPVIQRECDTFVTYWNTHRIRKQKNLELSAGVPDHIFSFPEEYGGENRGSSITKQHLEEVAEVSGILTADMEYMNENIKRECLLHIPNPSELAAKNCRDAFLFLKSQFV